MLIPYVIDKQNGVERSFDLFSRLLVDRIIFLGEGVDDNVANVIIAQLLFLEKEDPDADINFYINSPGGSVSAGLAIYDVMQHVKCPISTVCVGTAASMGAVLLAAGSEGKRASLPNSRVMIHQVSAGFRGTATDINIQASEINSMMDTLMKILAKHTGKDEDQVRKDCDRDYWLSSAQAKEYGIIDEVFEK